MQCATKLSDRICWKKSRFKKKLTLCIASAKIELRSSITWEKKQTSIKTDATTLESRSEFLLKHKLVSDVRLSLTADSSSHWHWLKWNLEFLAHWLLISRSQPFEILVSQGIFVAVTYLWSLVSVHLTVRVTWPHGPPDFFLYAPK